MVRNQFIRDKLSIMLTDNLLDKLLDTDMDGLYVLNFSNLLIHFPQILQNVITHSIDKFDHDKIQIYLIVSKVINCKLTVE